MTTTFFGAAFDARDAARLATFWSAVLGRPVDAGATPQHAVINATAPELGPRLAFHQVPENKTAKNRFHPDLIATDFDPRLVGSVPWAQRCSTRSAAARHGGPRSLTPTATNST